MNKKVKAILIIAVICGIIPFCNGCTAMPIRKEVLPEATIEELEIAYNSMDADAMMDCLDEKTQKSITAGMKIAMGLVGAVTGVDLGFSAEDLIEALPLFQEIAYEYAGDMEYPAIDFQVLETYIKGKRATVYFVEAYSEEMIVANMVKEKSKWYITLGGTKITEESADRIIIAGQEEEDETDKEEEGFFQKYINIEKVEELLTELFSEA